MGLYVMIPSEALPCRECGELIVGGYLIDGGFYLTCRCDDCPHTISEEDLSFRTSDGFIVTAILRRFGGNSKA